MWGCGMWGWDLCGSGGAAAVAMAEEVVAMGGGCDYVGGGSGSCTGVGDIRGGDVDGGSDWGSNGGCFRDDAGYDSDVAVMVMVAMAAAVAMCVAVTVAAAMAVVLVTLWWRR